MIIKTNIWTIDYNDNPQIQKEDRQYRKFVKALDREVKEEELKTNRNGKYEYEIIKYRYEGDVYTDSHSVMADNLI